MWVDERLFVMTMSYLDGTFSSYFAYGVRGRCMVIAYPGMGRIAYPVSLLLLLV
jgi:hypothetical protein